MLVNVNCKAICQIDINTEEAFVMLCKTLDMNFVLNEDIDFIVKKNEDGENYIYIIKDGKEQIYDERGDLFIALRNVAINIFPNLSFRSEKYIYNN